MKQHERRYLWHIIGMLTVANGILLLAIWFVGVEGRRDCERHGVTVLGGTRVSCEVVR